VSKLKALALTALGLGIGTVCVLSQLYPSWAELAVPAIRIVYWIGGLFGAVMATCGLVFLVPPVPILTFTHGGVRVHPATIGNYVIPWPHVRRLEARVVGEYSVLFVYLDDASFLIERQNWFHREVSRILYPPLRRERVIGVSGNMLTQSPSEVVSRVRIAFEDELARYGVVISGGVNA
jgi:hypothetical protein